MTRITSIIAAALLALPSLAQAAVPMQIPLQGTLRDNAGAPVSNDTFEMTFTLYRDAEGEDVAWTTTRMVDVHGGIFRAMLGEDEPVDPSLFSGPGALWLGVTVEQEPELPLRPLASTPYALAAGDAAGLSCSGCVAPEALSPAAMQAVRDEALVAVAEAGYATSAQGLSIDGASAGVEASDVQGAITELKTLISNTQAATNVNEGAGTVRAHTNNFSLSAYGTARDYVHVIHPTPPKVMLHVYGEQAEGGGGSDDLVVAYDFAPNDYSSGAAGTAGESALLVDNPSVFSTGSQIMLHQSVGGSGTTTGTWEVASVVAVNGNTLQLVQPLTHSYVSDDTAKAQVVVGASFGHIELVNGGTLKPSMPLAADGSKGGIVYVRANKITVRSGGAIVADAMGYHAVVAGETAPEALLPGSGSPGSCGGSGGGGNKEEGAQGGAQGECAQGGQAGEALSVNAAAPLSFGGAGGAVEWSTGSDVSQAGAGGGIIALGAQTIILQEGGTISAKGGAATGQGAGGGAGGSVALFTDQAELLVSPDVSGGAGSQASSSEAWSGNGWLFVDAPVQTDSMSMNTHSHGGGYSPYHDEFWYPSWSGSTIYRHDREGNQLGSFNSGTGDMMGLWGDVDGSYYTANWGQDRVYKWAGMNNSSQLWNYYLGSTAGGVCSDGEHVYAMRNGGSWVYKLNKDNGNLVEQFELSGSGFSTLYGMVCLPGRIVRPDAGYTKGFIYDLETRQQIGEFSLGENPENVSFDGETMWISQNDSSPRGYRLVTKNLYEVGGYQGSVSTGDGGTGSVGHLYEALPIPGIVNESYPKGVKILVDGQDVTGALGDPNGKGSEHWDAEGERWGSSGLAAWATGPLDLTNVANWTLGEHTLEFEETGGAGGAIKSYLYLIQPFSESTPPVNDTCQSPVALDLSEGPVVLSGTTEDVMGKTLATDASSDENCGGVGGPEVVYQLTLSERSLINAVVTAPFYARMYVRSADCDGGEVVYCGANEIQTTPLEAGDYFLFVDSDASSQKGDFTLAVSLTSAVLPENDTCASPVPLVFSPGGIATHPGSTLYSLDQYQSWCAPVGGGPDVVYSFTAGTSQSITATVQSDEFQPTLTLYKGTCGEGEPYTCSSDGDLYVANQPGGAYFLVVDGVDEKEWGAFDLTISLQ